MVTKTQIQFMRSLQSRKVRDELGLFVVEGPKVVDELLAAPSVQVQDVFATAQFAEKFARRVQVAGGNLLEVGDDILRRMSSLTTAHGIVAVFSKPMFDPWPADGWSQGFTLILDSIQDPGNMGTIIRCADWFGVENVVCSSSCADAFNAKVVQATMGSITRVRVRYEADLPGFVEEHRGDIPVLAAALEGVDVRSMTISGGAFLVIGNESRGVDPELLAAADERVTISRLGGAESLNAGVATGILLSHLKRT